MYCITNKLADANTESKQPKIKASTFPRSSIRFLDLRPHHLAQPTMAFEVR
jgi:hypothetical protein